MAPLFRVGASMIAFCRPFDWRTLVFMSWMGGVCLLLVAGCSQKATAQSAEQRFRTVQDALAAAPHVRTASLAPTLGWPDTHPEEVSVTGSRSTRSSYREGGPRPAPVSVPAKEQSRFSETLLGSAIGVGIGVPLGAVLLRAAANEEEVCNDRGNSYDGDNCRLEQTVAGLLGTALIAGGGPTGAAQSLGQHTVDVYVLSILGQAVAGGLGYALGRALLPDASPVATGIAGGAPAAALGAAAGARVGADLGGSSRSAVGAFRMGRDGLRVGLPSIRVQPPVRTDARPTVHVTVFSAAL